MIGPIRIMHIAGAVVKVKELSGLCHGTKQRIVTPGTFFSLVKTHGTAFCVPFGGLDRAIKVQGQTGQPLALKSFNDH